MFDYYSKNEYYHLYLNTFEIVIYSITVKCIRDFERHAGTYGSIHSCVSISKGVQFLMADSIDTFFHA